MTKARATEQQFNELHNLITEEFLVRIKAGEATKITDISNALR